MERAYADVDWSGRAVIVHALPDNYDNIPLGTAPDQYTANSPAAREKTLATVDLAEGVRLQAQLRDIAHDKIAIGLPVQVRFERVKEDLTLPYFVPA